MRLPNLLVPARRLQRGGRANINGLSELNGCICRQARRVVNFRYDATLISSQRGARSPAPAVVNAEHMTICILTTGQQRARNPSPILFDCEHPSDSSMNPCHNKADHSSRIHSAHHTAARHDARV